MKQTIYFIPGLGASSKIFERIQLDKNIYNIKHLEWIEPFKNEKFNDYIKRFSKLITNENSIIVGVSFGGIIAQEIGKITPCKKIVIISSIKSSLEFSPIMKTFKKYKAYKLFPSKSIPFLLKWATYLPQKTSLAKKVKMYNIYLTQRSPYYLDWSMKMILDWNNKKPLENIIHIQGTKDHIFPIKHIGDSIITIKNGTHAMILLKASEISKILEEKLKE